MGSSDVLRVNDGEPSINGSCKEPIWPDPENDVPVTSKLEIS
jgi:hypothetical protein